MMLPGQRTTMARPANERARTKDVHATSKTFDSVSQLVRPFSILSWWLPERDRDPVYGSTLDVFTKITYNYG